jgi:hypothetical protein
MFILLWGSVQVWAQKRIGITKPELLSEYSSRTPYPWFGESILWVSGHGRAGTARVCEETLLLVLRRPQMAQFMIDAPGFRALAQSAGSTCEQCQRPMPAMPATRASDRRQRPGPAQASSSPPCHRDRRRVC